MKLSPRLIPLLLCVLTPVFCCVIHPSPVHAANECLPCLDVAEDSALLPSVMSKESLLRYQGAFRLWNESRAAWEEGRYADMERGISSIISAYPDSVWEAKARYLSGMHYKFSHEWDAAIVEFERALALPLSTRLKHDIKTSMACIYGTRGQFDAALLLQEEVYKETTDWDQKKYCGSWIKELRRLRGLKLSGLLDSCGFKTVAYILNRRGIHLADDAIRHALAAHDDSFLLSMKVLVETLQDFSLKPLGVSFAEKDLGTTRMPIITLMKPGHYFVVGGIDGTGVHIYDPDRGELVYSMEKFRELWSGYAIVLDEKPPTGKVVLLTLDEMGQLKGGYCPCCNQPGLGGDNPNVVNNNGGDPESCENSGMPHIKLNTTSLNWVIEDTDFRYRNQGPEVVFKRTYNNDSSAESVIGRSWTHSYNMFLSFFPGQIQVTRGSGKVDVYVDVGGGIYSPPTGVNNSLRRNGDGTYSLDSYSEKLTYRFTAEDGRLESITDRNGQSVTLGYYPNIPALNGSGNSGPGFFNYPAGLAIDSQGILYIADQANHLIQRYDTGGGLFLPTWGSLGIMTSPMDVAVYEDPLDNRFVFVVDESANRVQKLDAQGNVVIQWGSYGSGSGRFIAPDGIAVDGQGFVYVADTGNNRIQKFDADGTFVTSWGSAGTDDGLFAAPIGIEVRGGVIYVADSNNHRIQKFDTSGVFLGKWGTRGYGDGFLYYPIAISFDPSGNVYVTDLWNRVQKFDPAGVFIVRWGSFGSDLGFFNEPRGITASGQDVYVSDYRNNRVQKFLDQNNVISAIMAFGEGGMPGGVFNSPAGICLDGSGNRYVVDSGNDRVQKFDSSGIFIKSWGGYGWADGQFISPMGIASGAEGEIYVADFGSSRVQSFDSEGGYLATFQVPNPYGVTEYSSPTSRFLYVTAKVSHQVYRIDLQNSSVLVWGSYGSGNGQFNEPKGIAVDTDGNVYVADSCRIQKFTGDGQFITSWATYSCPDFLAYDAGYVYASTSTVSRVEKYSVDGRYMTNWGAVGTGPGGFNQPRGLVRDGAGYLIVVDGGNNRLQRFDSRYPLGYVLTAITDATGLSTVLIFGDNGKVQRIEDPYQHTVEFTYDETNHYLSTTTDMESMTSRFFYTTIGYIERMETPKAYFRFEYSAGYPSLVSNTILDRSSKSYQIAWDGFTQNKVTDPEGRVTYYRNGASGFTTRVQDPTGGFTEYEYDAHGNRNKITDAESHATSWVVNTEGRMTSYTDAGGHITTWAYQLLPRHRRPAHHDGHRPLAPDLPDRLYLRSPGESLAGP